MPKIKRGVIKGFSGSWGSGIATLSIQDSKTGKVDDVHCENAPTTRVLQDVFGDTITPGHTANGKGYLDKEIFWTMDDMGLMFGGFVPVGSLTEEELARMEAA